jgi:hypothetical protein
MQQLHAGRLLLALYLQKQEDIPECGFVLKPENTISAGKEVTSKADQADEKLCAAEAENETPPTNNHT